MTLCTVPKHWQGTRNAWLMHKSRCADNTKQTHRTTYHLALLAKDLETWRLVDPTHIWNIWVGSEAQGLSGAGCTDTIKNAYQPHTTQCNQCWTSSCGEANYCMLPGPTSLNDMGRQSALPQHTNTTQPNSQLSICVRGRSGRKRDGGRGCLVVGGGAVGERMGA